MDGTWKKKKNHKKVLEGHIEEKYLAGHKTTHGASPSPPYILVHYSPASLSKARRWEVINKNRIKWLWYTIVANLTQSPRFQAKEQCNKHHPAPPLCPHHAALSSHRCLYQITQLQLCIRSENHNKLQLRRRCARQPCSDTSRQAREHFSGCKQTAGGGFLHAREQQTELYQISNTMGPKKHKHIYRMTGVAPMELSCHPADDSF